PPQPLTGSYGICDVDSSDGGPGRSAPCLEVQCVSLSNPPNGRLRVQRTNSAISQPDVNPGADERSCAPTMRGSPYRSGVGGTPEAGGRVQKKGPERFARAG